MCQTGGDHRILLNHFSYVEHKVFKDEAVEINAYTDAFALPTPDNVTHLLMLQLYTGSQVQIICIYIAVVYKEAYWIYLKT